MDFRLRFLILILACPFLMKAGNEPQPLGARRAGFGGAYTGLSGDIWTIGANPAGLVGLTQMNAGLCMERRFMLKEINSGSFAFASPILPNHYGALDFSGYGFGGYNEGRLGLTYATNILQKISFGAKFNLNQTSIPEYGTRTTFVLDAGMHSQISKSLGMGFSVFNASQTYLNKNIREKIPTTLNLGISWRVSEKVLALADIQKNENYPISVRGGVEYKPIDMFSVRGGFSTQPVTLNLGFGFKYKNAVIDIATQYHETLGISPHLSLAYTFGNPPWIKADKKTASPKGK